MLLLLAETIRALALVEDVWRELSAIRSPRHDVQDSGILSVIANHYVTVHSMAHTRQRKTLRFLHLIDIIH